MKARGIYRKQRVTYLKKLCKCIAGQGMGRTPKREMLLRAARNRKLWKAMVTNGLNCRRRRKLFEERILQESIFLFFYSEISNFLRIISMFSCDTLYAFFGRHLFAGVNFTKSHQFSRLLCLLENITKLISLSIHRAGENRYRIFNGLS